tara:strand:- start:9453 stop:9932 length:480 start_codon:yes stop_codon:yes gene_type:complete
VNAERCLHQEGEKGANHMSDILNRLLSTRYETHSAASSPFAEGQVWRIESGQFAGTSFLIVKTEDHPFLGHAVHVSVRGPLMIEGDPVLDGIPHLPFTIDALEASDVELTGFVTDMVDDWKGMHADWEKDAQTGEAGLFSLPVEDVLTTIMVKLSAVLS